MTKAYYIIAALGTFAGIANADAAGTDQPMFIFGGFGSMGISHSSMGSGDYVPDSSIPSGPGRTAVWSTTNDTRIAGNVAAQFTPKISALLQIDSEYHSGNSYQPEVEWAHVKYAFTPEASIRVGRLALPTFMEAENRDIGYTYAWIHPPVEVYRQEPITNSDGFDVTYRSQTGEWGNSIKALYGSAMRPTYASPVPSDLTSRNLWGIFDTVEYGSTTIHAAFQQRKTDSGLLLTGQGETLVTDKDLSAGVQYDPGDWFMMSEWILRESTYKTSAMYVSGGYRIKKFTPYLTYAQNSLGSFLPGSPPPSQNALTLANREQSTISLGMRWDFMRDTDLKLQFDQVKLSANSNGYLENVPANVTLFGSTFHVISAVVDFIF
ncbi:MAG: Uncharacterized protein AWT59_1983 [Candidatus Gallionella acididurans]|uniref:Porin domain-containing protein n=1 Tax=Candidatus Gallionella acididurans TaxID=1796491 RepID=A0A139BSC7_9PROT|nr:MAG: Uncharacterized protein AWT59_1983 [Candidatus Gallionella acididurans]